MDLPTVLQHIGLPDREVDVYMMNAKLGLQPASVLADRLKINRITTYTTLKKLVERGLAHMCVKNGMQYFGVEPPQKLMTYVARKEEEWRQLQTKLQSALEEIETPTREDVGPMRAASYLGIEGCKTLFLEALQAQKLVLVLNPDNKPSEYRDLWLHTFFRQLLTTLPKTVHIFTTKEGLPLPLVEELEEAGAEVYLLETLPFSMDLILCDDVKSAFIVEQQGILSGVLLEGTQTQHSLQEFFSRTLSSLAGGFNFLVTPAA